MAHHNNPRVPRNDEEEEPDRQLHRTANPERYMRTSRFNLVQKPKPHDMKVKITKADLMAQYSSQIKMTRPTETRPDSWKEVRAAGVYHPHTFFEVGETLSEEAIFSLAIRELSLPETDQLDCYCMFASAIAAIIPQSTDMLKRLCKMAGADPKVYSSYAELVVDGIDILNVQEFAERDIVVTIFLMIFMLYKNIAEPSYKTFFENRHVALKSKVSMKNEEKKVPFPYVVAKHIRGHFGSNEPLKKRIFEWMVNMAKDKAEDNFYANPAGYTLDILGWTDMSYFKFMIENLLLTRSPVLLDKRLASEFDNLLESLKAISKYKNPVYFRLMAEPNQLYLLSKKRFEILATVAARCWTKHQRTYNQFVTPRQVENSDETFIQHLIMVHQGWVAAHPNLKQVSISTWIGMMEKDGEAAIEKVRARVAQLVREGKTEWEEEFYDDQYEGIHGSRLEKDVFEESGYDPFSE